MVSSGVGVFKKMIRKLFSRLAFLPRFSPSWVDRETLDDILLMPEARAGQTHLTAYGDGQAIVSVSGTADGGTLDFELDFKKDGEKFITKIQLSRISPDTYNIDSFIFDNKREHMQTSAEVMNALSHVGQQLRGLRDGVMPQPHDETVKPFSPRARESARFWS
jgi:hypothetical protein